jgi:hypothetical protein
MKCIRVSVVAAGLICTLGAASAQGGPGMRAGMGPGAAASGAEIGPGMHAGRAQAGAEFTPGWSLMTPAERTAHRQQMSSMKTYDECKAYMDKHHEEMAARAKEKGGKPLPAPRRDGCLRLKP